MSESDLRREVSNIAPSLRARLDAAGFDEERLVALAASLQARARGESAADRQQRNQIRGVVEPPRAGDIRLLPAPGSPERLRLGAIGLDLMPIRARLHFPRAAVHASVRALRPLIELLVFWRISFELQFVCL